MSGYSKYGVARALVVGVRGAAFGTKKAFDSVMNQIAQEFFTLK